MTQPFSTAREAVSMLEWCLGLVSTLIIPGWAQDHTRGKTAAVGGCSPPRAHSTVHTAQHSAHMANPFQHSPPSTARPFRWPPMPPPFIRTLSHVGLVMSSRKLGYSQCSYQLVSSSWGVYGKVYEFYHYNFFSRDSSSGNYE